MKKNLIKNSRGKLFCTSIDIGLEFVIMHNQILVKIRKLIVDIPTVKKEFEEAIFTNERNREYPMYHISRRGYMSLVLNLDAKSKESKLLLMQKKELFIDAFDAMEKRILKEQNNKQNVEWNKSREQGKHIRLELSDAIKEFVEHANNQGSTQANRYYSNITKMEYKALGFVQEAKPKIRETLDLMELHQLILAEDLCRRKLKQYMNEKLHYKEIYILVKQDIEKFANVLYLKGGG